MPAAGAAAKARFGGGRRELACLAAATLGLLLAVRGQIQLDLNRDWWWDGAALMLVAVLLWLVALWLLGRSAALPEPAMPVVAAQSLSRERRIWLLAGLGLVAFTAVLAPLWTGASGGGLGMVRYPNVPAGWAGAGQPDPVNTFHRIGTWMWLAGTALYVLALAERRSRSSTAASLVSLRGLNLRLTWTAVAVLAITLFGAWFRFHDLANVPFEMTSDHTEKVLDVASIQEGLRPVYLPNNAGREPAEFYWLAFLAWLGVPNGFLLLKLGMAVVSTLNIPLLYFWGKWAVGREVGLLAALAMALSYWHVVITRIGLRIAFSPLFVTLTLYFLYRAVQTGRRNDFLLLGASMGLGLYGYSGYRPIYLVVPLAIALKLGHDAWHRWRAGQPARLLPRPVAAHLVAAAGLALLLMAPMLRFAADRPDTFWGRTATRMFGAEQATPNPILEQLLINIGNGLLMFHYTADSSWFQAAPFRPALDSIGGGLLLIGVVTAIYLLLRYRSWRVGMLLLVVPAMLASSILALSFPNENPSLTRAAGALPAICVLVALPLPLVRRAWRAGLGGAGTLVYVAMLCALSLSMFHGSWQRYFGEYAVNYDSSTQNTSDGAAVAASYAGLGVDRDHVYLVGWSNGWDYRAVGILLGDPRWRGLLWGSDSSGADAVFMADMQVLDPAPKLYLVGGEHTEANLRHLRELYPDAMAVRHASRIPGKDFWSVYVPASGETAESGGG
jgi:hypothetical protein